MKRMLVMTMFLVMALFATNSFAGSDFIVAKINKNKTISTIEGNHEIIKEHIMKEMKNNTTITLICHYSQFFEIIGIISEIDHLDWTGRTLTELDDKYVVIDISKK